MPEQSPLQPMKVLPLPGVAVSVTLVLVLKVALKASPQSMPDGLPVMAPEPLPDLLMASENESNGCPARTRRTWPVSPLSPPLAPPRLKPTPQVLTRE